MTWFANSFCLIRRQSYLLGHDYDMFHQFLCSIRRQSYLLGHDYDMAQHQFQLPWNYAPLRLKLSHHRRPIPRFSLRHCLLILATLPITVSIFSLIVSCFDGRCSTHSHKYNPPSQSTSTKPGNLRQRRPSILLIASSKSLQMSKSKRQFSTKQGSWYSKHGS